MFQLTTSPMTLPPRWSFCFLEPVTTCIVSFTPNRSGSGNNLTYILQLHFWYVFTPHLKPNLDIDLGVKTAILYDHVVTFDIEVCLFGNS